MSNLVIQIENLSKAYSIFHTQDKRITFKYKTLQEDIMALPSRWLSALRGQRNAEREIIWALKDISFDVHEGEVIGIIGRNGSGKSTLLKILSRITDPTEGMAKIYGRLGSLLEVGTGFHPELTGRENIFLNGAILGMRRAEIDRKLDEIVAFAEVEKFIDTPVKHYSSGMYVRLAFAVAANLDSDILLVDEVLAVGDMEFQKKCLNKMENVAHQGRAVLFVSHSMSVIQRLCSRTILLSAGKMNMDGKTINVVEQYLSSGLSQQGERLWSDISRAPGNDVVRLKSVCAYNTQQKICSEYTVREPMALEAEFRVLQGGHPLEVSFSLYDASGNLLFPTLSTSNKEWQGKPYRTGDYRARCEIPGDFLNDGQIRIMVAITSKSTVLHAIEPDALAIRIVDDLEGGGARGNYIRDWPGGTIRPLLKWEIAYTQNKLSE